MNPPILEANREAFSGVDLCGTRNNASVLPFRNGIPAPQRRERTEDIQPLTEAVESIPMTRHPARSGHPKRHTYPFEAVAIRIEPAT